MSRQPARSTLGVLGVAAVGALLFDMLLLSEGLVVSMRDLFERMGFDIRIIATDQLPAGSPDIRDASTIAAKIAALPTVQSALTIRTEDADFQTTSGSAKDRLHRRHRRGGTTSLDGPARARSARPAGARAQPVRARRR